jgi:hypothetical protein
VSRKSKENKVINEPGGCQQVRWQGDGGFSVSFFLSVEKRKRKRREKEKREKEKRERKNGK